MLAPPFSGADITEICQRACKSAIRENIEKDMERCEREEKGEGGVWPHATTFSARVPGQRDWHIILIQPRKP